MAVFVGAGGFQQTARSCTASRSREGHAVHREEVAGVFDLDWRTDDPDLVSLLPDREGKLLFEFLADAVQCTRWQQDLRTVAEPVGVSHCRFLMVGAV